MAGRATNFTASGTLNPDDTMFGFDIYVFLKDPDVDPTCAADFDTESANALHSGGNESWVSPAGGFQVGDGPRVQPAVQDHVHRPRQLPALRVRPGRLLHVRGRGAARGRDARADPTPDADPPDDPDPTPRLRRRARAVDHPQGPRADLSRRRLVERADQPQLSLVRQGHSKTSPRGRKLTVRRSLRGPQGRLPRHGPNAAGRGTASSRRSAPAGLPEQEALRRSPSAPAWASSGRTWATY